VTTVWTPNLPLPRWLAFAQPVVSWYQLHRDLADLRSDLEREVADQSIATPMKDHREPCPA
jgi:hypothetical protein